MNNLETSQGGFALIIVLVALVGVTALAGAGLMMSDSDLRMSQNSRAVTHAFYTANAGLHEYLATERDGEDTITYSYTSGAATVEGRKLLDVGDGRILYRLTSNGRYAPPEGGIASRTVSTVAMYAAADITVPASFTAPAGLLKDGGAGTISGTDYASAGDPACPNSPAASVAGVAVPPSGFTQNGGTLVPDGDPPVDDSDSAAQLLADTGIDWDGIVNGGLVVPDYTIPPDSWPSFNSLPPDSWPVIYVDGNHSVGPSDDGRGTLIVRNNLTMNGTFQWEGMILVGGYITSTGYQTIEGATVSGLNILLGESVPFSDIGNGNKVFKYNSCSIIYAATAFGGLSQLPGSWVEVM